MTKITINDLVRELILLKGSTFINIRTKTKVTMNKTNNPFYDRVEKDTWQVVNINFDYENAVNNKLTKEGKEADFEAKARKWGERVDNTPIITHKGEFYVELGFLNDKQKPKVTYLLDGNVATEDELLAIKPFFKEKNEETLLEHQGTENVVKIRDVKLSNIKEIKINGNHYILD